MTDKKANKREREKPENAAAKTTAERRRRRRSGDGGENGGVDNYGYSMDDDDVTKCRHSN